MKDEENRANKVVTLPDHLILDHILPRLPVKPLLRFKSVCRCWRSTISTPEFEKFHLAFSGNHHQFVILPKTDGWLSTSNIINNPNYLVIRENYNTYKYKYRLAGIIGCCNGLVGFSATKSDGRRIFIVLNPATRQHVEIRGPNNETCWYWFGYVSSMDDYYIVAFHTSGEVFWTFSWKAGIWKRNLCMSDESVWTSWQWHTLKRIGKPALINDSLYWPFEVCWDPNLGVGAEIVEINLVTEKYEIKPQMNLGIEHIHGISLVNLEGCLVLQTTSPEGCLVVWMLRQAGDWNSWERVYSQVLRHCYLIYYSTTGKLLVGYLNHLNSVDDLSQLQPEEQESDEFREIQRKSLYLHYNSVDDYVESMIWPFLKCNQCHDSIYFF